MIEPLATWLANQIGLTLHVTLFLGELPATPVACVAIMESPGLSPDATGTPWESPRWVVLIRDGTYAACRQRAEQVRTALDVANVTIGTSFYQRIDPMPPSHYDTDRNGHPVLAVVAEGSRTLSVLS